MSCYTRCVLKEQKRHITTAVWLFENKRVLITLQSGADYGAIRCCLQCNQVLIVSRVVSGADLYGFYQVYVLIGIAKLVKNNDIVKEK